MKRHLLFALVLTLIPLAAFAAAQEPAVEAGSSVDCEQPAVDRLFTVDGEPEPMSALGPIEPCDHPDPLLDCDRWDSNWCDYVWTCRGCCEAVWSAPGAACGPICV